MTARMDHVDSTSMSVIPVPVIEEYVFWSVRVLVDEASPLGCALRKVAMPDLTSTNTLSQISTTIRADEGEIIDSDDGHHVHTAANVRYSESTDSVPYQNLCFVSKVICSNLNIVALERSAANLERYTKLQNKLQVVSQAGLRGAEELMRGETNSLGIGALPSLAQLARGIALGMHKADNNTAMQSEHHHHHHHSSHVEDLNNTDYDSVIASMKSCQCCMTGRLHWVTDVTPLIRRGDEAR